MCEQAAFPPKTYKRCDRPALNPNTVFTDSIVSGNPGFSDSLGPSVEP